MDDESGSWEVRGNCCVPCGWKSELLWSELFCAIPDVALGSVNVMWISFVQNGLARYLEHNSRPL